MSSARILDEALLRRAQAHAAAYLESMSERHVGAQATRDELLAALRTPLLADGEDPTAVLNALAEQGARGTMASAGPRYFGFVIGGSLPVALAADWLTSTWDQNPGIYATSPIMSVIEDVAREWLLDLLDLPRNSSLGFVTGCQMAHFTGLAAARHGVLRRAGWNVEDDGLAGAPRIHLITSGEAHVTVDVAMRYLGFGTRTLLRVETDGQGRMRADRLRRLLDNLHGPIIICAQAGNVNTGAFDPLREIAELAQEHGAWLHVDGAFGLWARTSAELRPLADGIDLADSIATDAHKWLNVPYDSGIVITRHPDDHRASMTATAAYLVQTKGVERDAVDWVPEFSRRGRGVAVYAAIRALGRSGVEAMIDRNCANARQMADLLRRDPRVQILNDVVLNQVLVRFGNDDDLTRAVIAGVQEEGTCWLGGTTWQNLAAMRISFSNWATSAEDVDRSGEAILKVL
ncbi:MAG TPA: aminotransferase class V-fold PLP-dependent enzyme, partial [Thermoanaerobaculia bacterium]|nr:aminotransferase class V-fold PLP-dependent enzyme [Thermoanaerobaculia bacterium]